MRRFPGMTTALGLSMLFQMAATPSAVAAPGKEKAKTAKAAAKSDGSIPDFTVKPVGKGKPFKLSDARGKYVAIHFLLKTDCPICMKYTRDYAAKAKELPDVVQLFLKPDAPEDTTRWFSKYPKDDPNKPVIYQDPKAKLAEKMKIPDGYEFHGEVVHYPALVLVDPEGKEAFRHVGQSTLDRFWFPKLMEKMKELRQ